MAEMVERFTWAQVNHYLWLRQGFDWDRFDGPETVLESVIGIYATSPTCYLSILARAANFRFPDLDEYMVERRGAVRMRAMRYSNFIIPVTLLPSVYQARKTDRPNPIKEILKSGMTDAQYEDVSQSIEQLLGDGSVCTAGEIKKALPFDPEKFGPAFAYVIPQMCEEGRLVRAGKRGGWKSDLYEYSRLDHWLPGIDLNEVAPERGRTVLARLYFDAYGPATAEDFRWWSGFSKEETAGAIAALGDELLEIQVEGTGHWILARRLDEMRRCPVEPPPGVRLLPVWDAYLMAYRDRRRYLSEPWYDSVYAGTGDATSTVLLDGVPGGIWDFQEDKKTLVVKVALFNRSRPHLWDELRDQVIRLAEVVGFRAAILLRCEPVSLRGSPQNRFKSPLKDANGETIFVI